MRNLPNRISVFLHFSKLSILFIDCSVRWFGSHSNGIALANNNMLNMDLLVQSKEDAAATFLKFISVVEENFRYRNYANTL